uniref:Uncharacterized protein n=1 Tax=Daphnia magna TaxID=35525 RepID=A0A0P5DS83_9CRUS
MEEISRLRYCRTSYINSKERPRFYLFIFLLGWDVLLLNVRLKMFLKGVATPPFVYTSFMWVVYIGSGIKLELVAIFF